MAQRFRERVEIQIPDDEDASKSDAPPGRMSTRGATIAAVVIVVIVILMWIQANLDTFRSYRTPAPAVTPVSDVDLVRERVHICL
jgi:hypothetical protein